MWSKKFHCFSIRKIWTKQDFCTDRRMDGQGDSYIYIPPNFICVGYKNFVWQYHKPPISSLQGFFSGFSLYIPILHIWTHECCLSRDQAWIEQIRTNMKSDCFCSNFSSLYEYMCIHVYDFCLYMFILTDACQHKTM